MTDINAMQAFMIEETTGWSLIQFAGWSAAIAALENQVATRSGIEAPKAVGDLRCEGSMTLIRVAPDRFWLLDDSGKNLSELKCDPAIACLTPLGEGRQRFRLGGPRCREVLKKCVAIDWDSPASAPGRAVQTMLHRVPVLLLPRSADAFDLFVPRTFARSIREWIVDAAGEFAQA